MQVQSVAETASAGVTGEICKLAEESNRRGKQIGSVIQESLHIIENITAVGTKAEVIFKQVYDLVKDASVQESKILNTMREQEVGNKELLMINSPLIKNKIMPEEKSLVPISMNPASVAFRQYMLKVFSG